MVAYFAAKMPLFTRMIISLFFILLEFVFEPLYIDRDAEGVEKEIAQSWNPVMNTEVVDDEHRDGNG